MRLRNTSIIHDVIMMIDYVLSWRLCIVCVEYDDICMYVHEIYLLCCYSVIYIYILFVMQCDIYICIIQCDIHCVNYSILN